MTRIAVLGAGPAGLAVGWLLKRPSTTVTVYEAEDQVGGLAASFEHDGVSVDHGSHRLHAACDPAILAELRALLAASGQRLIKRRRRGRLRIGQRWLPFPLSPLGLLTGLPPRLLLAGARELLGARKSSEATDFRGLIEDGFGPSLARNFYFPYAKKIWGLEPEELAPELARKRIAGSGGWREKIGAMLLRRGRSFYYPEGGFGAISTALAKAFKDRGGELRLGARVTGLEDGAGVKVEGEDTRTFDLVFSTLSISILARLLEAETPTELRFRALLLVYWSLDRERYSPYDAHDFPDDRTLVSRVSEPKNYGAPAPKDRTALCIEVPCWPEDPLFSHWEPVLAGRLRSELAVCGLSLPEPRRLRVVKRRFAYPVYERGYEEKLARLQGIVDERPWLLSLGRHGLFAHDNTHHALAAAYAAARCVRGGAIDREAWERERAAFREHRVED